MPPQSGKLAYITGANSGLGAITAREPEAAEGAMRAHVERAARLVEIYYRDAHGDER